MEHAPLDLYAILEVSPQASSREIKRAYRKKVKHYHPDLHQVNSETERKIREINLAYEVLSDPEKRKEYDQARRDREATLRQTDKQPPPPTAGPYEERRSQASQEIPEFSLSLFFTAEMWSEAWWPIIKVFTFIMTLAWVVGQCTRP